jgi:hypothetical protein
MPHLSQPVIDLFNTFDASILVFWGGLGNLQDYCFKKNLHDEIVS